ncbi:hypothetical protein ACO229_10560 [Promicromonospora sp. MS192]|uniref:hypothetical protein n=1 Tax=Promicromonospora sp. MS192 TaxID=3412684 RepID=UPI003C2F930B
MSISSTGAGTKLGRRLVAVVVALLSVLAVGVAAPAVASTAGGTAAAEARLDGGGTGGGGGGGGGGSWSAGDDGAAYAPAKGDPSIWPKPEDVRANLTEQDSRYMVEDCPLYRLCVRNQEADGQWTAYALYHCLQPGQYYELTNFTGTVYAQNSQDVTARFLRADNSVADTIGPNTGKDIYWNPIWKIDPC